MCKTLLGVCPVAIFSLMANSIQLHYSRADVEIVQSFSMRAMLQLACGLYEAGMYKHEENSALSFESRIGDSVFTSDAEMGDEQ